MKISYSKIFLLSITFTVTGCQLAERGMSLPAPKNKPSVKPKTSDYEFPLLKISAFPSTKNDTNISTKKESVKAETTIEQRKKTKNNNSEFFSLIHSISGILDSPSDINDTKSHTVKKNKIIKSSTDTKSKHLNTTKNIKIKPRHRKSGYNSKLIFSKETSLKNIPLPLPKLSSLKLKSLVKSLPVIPLSKIPILNSIIPKGSSVSNKRIKDNMQPPMHSNISNKKNITESLDMANIRIGKSEDYTTLIFDSYKWAGYNKESIETVNESGNYEFKYEPKNNRIVAVINGYTSFSALLGDQSQLFKESDIIKNIYIDSYIGENSIKFIIQLKKSIQMTVQNMKKPGRIIVNLYPEQ